MTHEPPRQAPRLTVTTLIFTLAAREPLRLPPFVVSTLRGAVGRALRGLACLTGAPTCEACPYLQRCAYGAIWEPQTPPPPLPRSLRTPQRPYVIVPPEGTPTHGPVTLHPPGELSFQVRLVGAARTFAHQLVVAVDRAAARGLGPTRAPAELLRVDILGPDPGQRRPYDPGRAVPPVVIQPDVAAPGPPRSVLVELASPLRLKRQRRVVEDLDRDALVALTARLTARLDALAVLYEGRQAAWDYGHLRDLAQRVRVTRTEALRTVRFHRTSTRGGGAKKIPMAGLMGRLWLEDVAPPLLSLWRCAETLHVGSNAAFGFGRLTLEDLGPSPRAHTPPAPTAAEPTTPEPRQAAPAPPEPPEADPPEAAPATPEPPEADPPEVAPATPIPPPAPVTFAPRAGDTPGPSDDVVQAAWSPV